MVSRHTFCGYGLIVAVEDVAEVLVGNLDLRLSVCGIIVKRWIADGLGRGNTNTSPRTTYSQACI